MKAKIPRIIGVFCVFAVCLEISLTWAFFSEACDDALKRVPAERYAPMGEILLVIAPFGLFPIFTPMVAAVLYWRLTMGSVPRAHELMFPILFALFGLMAMVISAEYTKQFLYMDGGKGGSVAAWFFNGSLNAGMLWLIQRSSKIRKVELQESEDPQKAAGDRRSGG